MNGNYTGNERSRAVKLRAAVLGVADIARARNSHFNFPTLSYPNEAPNLHKVHGEEFEKLFEQFEREGHARKTIYTQQPWFAILDAQSETGTSHAL